ncbi:hypothetical protein [Gulosibacter sp. 10]|uniref:hypothetical protein n=1 Tax=Gulosibacter sp. 10 TaxID=1255570 RepID=UPI00097F08B0|nr:hypothetical protein [Gulosibacter sp. 10]SJM50649.1 putative minor silk ampullate protein [Gulosibacter sp. 10]
MTRIGSRVRAIGAALAALALAFMVLPALAQPAQAAAQVTISGEPDPNGQSEITVSGSGFQSVQGGFGGIYVLFGWVDDPSGGSWKPSNGGATGTDYRYVYDDESNPAGFQLFVTFPGSSTASAANGGEVAADGTWSGTMKIPGAVFQTFDRQLNETTVDCTEVTCGIITIGAHGVKNPNNETFTPVTFAGGAGGGAAATPETESPDEAAAPTAEQQGGQEAAPAQGQQQVTAPAEQDTSGTEAAVSGLTLLGWMPVLLPAILLLGLSLVILAAGFGGYLAAKGLLLGVNPEALEKVRGQRERAAVRQREKQRRKTRALERKQELASARAAEKDSAMVARAEMRHQGGPPKSEGVESVDQWLGFFKNGKDGAASSDERLFAPPAVAPGDGATGAPRHAEGDAPTEVLTAAGANTGNSTGPRNGGTRS